MKSGRSRQESYEQLFIRFSCRIERGLVKAIIALSLFLVAAQVVLHIPEWRSYVSKVDRLEGKQSFVSPQSGEIMPLTIERAEE